MRTILQQLRAAFGDPTHESVVAAAKAVLNSPNAPLQEQAQAIGLLSSEPDAESKNLILFYATSTQAHTWLQQVAGEAVAQMLEGDTIMLHETEPLTAQAKEWVAAFLEVSEKEHLREFARILHPTVPAPPLPTAGEA